MKRLIHVILNDIRSGHNIEGYVTFVVAVGIALVSLFDAVSQRVVNAVILSVLAYHIYKTINMQNFVVEQMKQHVGSTGIRNVYTDRSELPPLGNTLRSARKSVFIIGLQLGSVVHENIGTILEIARKGVRVRLLFGPQTSHVECVENMEDILYTSELVSQIHRNIKIVRNALLSERGDWVKNVEVRVYKHMPTIAAILVDVELPDGFVRIEPIVPYAFPTERPIFEIDRRTTPWIYENIVRAFNRLWDSSHAYLERGKNLQSDDQLKRDIITRNKA